MKTPTVDCTIHLSVSNGYEKKQLTPELLTAKELLCLISLISNIKQSNFYAANQNDSISQSNDILINYRLYIKLNDVENIISKYLGPLVLIDF